MLRVASVHARFVTLEQGVSVDVDQAVVIARNDQLLVLRHAHSVHVGTVGSRWEDALHALSELAGLVRSDGLDRVGST